MFGEKVNAIINEYAGKEALGIKFISEPEDKLTIFANVFKESPFSFSYPIRSIGYCERQIAEYNLTTEEQIACIFHEIGHIVRGSACIAGQNRQLYVFVRRNKRFTGQGDFERKTWVGREVACLRHVRSSVILQIAFRVMCHRTV